MTDWEELTTDEIKELIDDINAAERRNTQILKEVGIQLEPSILRYNPGRCEVGPLPRYIPTKKQPITEPPISFGPKERIKINRRDKLNAAKRQLAFLDSLEQTDGQTTHTKQEKNKHINIIKQYRKIRNYRKSKTNIIKE